MLVKHGILTIDNEYDAWLGSSGTCGHCLSWCNILKGVSTLTWDYHFTDITTSTVFIFLREMQLHFGPFLPLHHDSLLMHVSSNVDSWFWHHCFAMHNCQKNMPLLIKRIHKLGFRPGSRFLSLLEEKEGREEWGKGHIGGGRKNEHT